MKKLLLIFLVFITLSKSYSCNYTLVCFDSSGNGWGGAYLQVNINGIDQGQYFAISFGTAYSFSADSGSIFQMWYFSGSSDNENSWSLKNESDSLIASDGPNPQTGLVVTHTMNCYIPPPPINSDCNGAISICTNLGLQIDPDGFGNINEIPALGSLGNPDNNNPGGSGNMGCLRIGENNSTWMIINISSSGNLEFNFGGSSQAGYYDWILYPYNQNTCNYIPSNLVAPVRCNWNSSSYGGTGCLANIPVNCSPGNFEPALPVIAGEKYIFCFNSYSSAMTNLPIVFVGTAGVDCQSVDIKKIKVTSEFAISVFPNPATIDNLVIIRLSNFDKKANNETHIIVNDIMGREILSETKSININGEIIFEIGSLKKILSGTYILSLSLGFNKYYAKLIIK